MYGHHKDEKPYKTVRLKQILDGTSKTILVGEAWHDSQTQRKIGRQQESARGDHKDHWYIGGDDPDIYNDSSECLGSTGVRPNLHLLNKCGDGASDRECQELQISFSSAHRGIVNVVMCDGSVRSVSYAISVALHQALASTNGQEITERDFDFSYRQFRDRLRQQLGANYRPELIDDVRFATGKARSENRVALNALINEATQRVALPQARASLPSEFIMRMKMSASSACGGSRMIS